MDALVRKGILTEQEAEDIKADVHKESRRYNKWVMNSDGIDYKLYGDVRGRYEFFRTPNDLPGTGANNKPRDRFRYRLRAGITATLFQNFEVGMRLTSSEAQGTFGGDPISGNTTFQDNGSKKFVYIDTAYGKWTMLTNSHGTSGHFLSTTIGKMDNPFVVSDMVFDADYTPEGLALQGGYIFNNQHSLKAIGGLFILDEISQGALASNDPLMWGGQLRWDANWVTEVEQFPKIQSSVGLGWFALSELDSLGNAAVPNINVGNTRFTASDTNGSTHVVAGNLVNEYAPIVGDASVTLIFEKAPFYPGQFPIRIGGEFMHNPRADEENNAWWAGVFLGKSGKRGTWELSYRYKRLESDAWFEEFVDSDFGTHYEIAHPGSSLGNGYRAGTGLQGHITKLAYSLSDSVSIGATWFFTEQINPARVGGVQTETEQHRVQIDAIWKF
jgi:hypothetical protein